MRMLNNLLRKVLFCCVALVITNFSTVFGQTISQIGEGIRQEFQKISTEAESTDNPERCELLGSAYTFLVSYKILKSRYPSAGLRNFPQTMSNLESKIRVNCENNPGGLDIGPFTFSSNMMYLKKIKTHGRVVSALSFSILFMDEKQKEAFLKDLETSDPELSAQVKQDLQSNQDFQKVQELLMPEINQLQVEKEKQILNAYLTKEQFELKKLDRKPLLDLKKPEPKTIIKP